MKLTVWPLLATPASYLTVAGCESQAQIRHPCHCSKMLR